MREIEVLDTVDGEDEAETVWVSVGDAARITHMSGMWIRGLIDSGAVTTKMALAEHYGLKLLQFVSAQSLLPLLSPQIRSKMGAVDDDVLLDIFSSDRSLAMRPENVTQFRKKVVRMYESGEFTSEQMRFSLKLGYNLIRAILIEDKARAPKTKIGRKASQSFGKEVLASMWRMYWDQQLNPREIAEKRHMRSDTIPKIARALRKYAQDRGLRMRSRAESAALSWSKPTHGSRAAEKE